MSPHTASSAELSRTNKKALCLSFREHVSTGVAGIRARAPTVTVTVTVTVMVTVTMATVTTVTRARNHCEPTQVHSFRGNVRGVMRSVIPSSTRRHVDLCQRFANGVHLKAGHRLGEAEAEGESVFQRRGHLVSLRLQRCRSLPLPGTDWAAPWLPLELRARRQRRGTALLEPVTLRRPTRRERVKI